ncbi:alanine racemase [Pontixanthobacter luteolus]|uniref:alanine racemase n=1 Tax=Pontixanthobacter luteolus TaxID=295089 RepID=UPI00230209DE|nr:alanine racemase [Pontixanthobacter luteolus]
MADLPPSSLRLLLDEGAIAANWRTLSGLSGGAVAGAAVKANAYGLGVEFAVPALREAGCADFYVAHWGEAAKVAPLVKPTELSVLHGPLTDEHVAFAIATGVRPVINSLQQAKRWLDGGGGICDLMIDTGINRLGVAMADISEPVLQELQIETLMSHLSSADEDSAANAAQLGLFRQASAQFSPRRRSLANSAGIALGADYAFDITRPGLSLYGGVPRPELAEAIRQVAFPQAAIMQLRKLAAGDRVGYNGEYTARRDMLAGIVSLGYADGFLRSWGARGALSSNGRMLPLLGKVSMDMVVVDLGGAPDLKEGDWLDVPYHLPDAARTSGLSQYELLTTLGKRYDRQSKPA